MTSRHSTVLRHLRTAGIATVVATVAAGCATPAPDYFWSHANSGEYLFAFDAGECGAQPDLDGFTGARLPAQGSVEGAAFSACMTERGYFLVDPVTNRPVAGTPAAVLAARPQVSSAD